MNTITGQPRAKKASTAGRRLLAVRRLVAGLAVVVTATVALIGGHLQPASASQSNQVYNGVCSSWGITAAPPNYTQLGGHAFYWKPIISRWDDVSAFKYYQSAPGFIRQYPGDTYKAFQFRALDMGYYQISYEIWDYDWHIGQWVNLKAVPAVHTVEPGFPGGVPHWFGLSAVTERDEWYLGLVRQMSAPNFCWTTPEDPYDVSGVV